jgi:chromosome segregation ATPase
MTDAVTTLTSNVDPYSTVGWERKVDSLERELKTLKDIIKTDSDQRLKLQAEIETLRSTKTETSSGTGVPGGSVDALMQERDDLRERDSQHLETIKILTEELNTLAKTSQSSRELDQLRLENELFASQIVENENEMQELRSTLKILEEENKRLIDEIANVQTTESTQGINTGREHSSGNPWKDQLESLAARVADIECDRDRRNQSLEAERRKVHAELESIRAIALARNPTADRFVRGDVGGHQSNKSEELINDVEVTLEGKILTSATSLLECPNNDKNQAQEKMERNKSWGGFCDCFLSANQEEEP